jgi:Holliday junction resolvase RusA-like endonuclease
MHLEIEIPHVTAFKAPGRKGNRYYNPLSKEKTKYQWIVKSQYRGPPMAGALRCSTFFFLKAPAFLKPRDGIHSWCLKRIDLDNCMKFLLDACKGILMEDDSQICIMQVMKIWSETNHTKLFLDTL